MQQHPGLYDVLEGLQSTFRRWGYRLKGSKADGDYWAKRHLDAKKRFKDDWSLERIDWLEGYKNSVTHTHRQFLVDRLREYAPLSVLEIGSNCGPNLMLLAEQLKDAEMVGIDINPAAVEQGNLWAKEKGISNLKFLLGDATCLSSFTAKKFDLVFADAVLLYLGPDAIENVAREMLRVAKKGVVLMEWHEESGGATKWGRLRKHWVRNYRLLFADLVGPEQVRISKLPDHLWEDRNWKRFGALIEVLNPSQ